MTKAQLENVIVQLKLLVRAQENEIAELLEENKGLKKDFVKSDDYVGVLEVKVERLERLLNDLELSIERKEIELYCNPLGASLESQSPSDLAAFIAAKKEILPLFSEALAL
jgi:hypothetical protein